MTKRNNLKIIVPCTILVIGILVATAAYAPPPPSAPSVSWTYAEQVDAGIFDADIATDAKGNNIYVAANSRNGNNKNIFVIKVDDDGDYVWKKTYDSGNDDIARGIALDNEDNVYVAGARKIGNGFYGLLLKYNSSGTLQWSRTSGGQEYEEMMHGVSCCKISKTPLMVYTVAAVNLNGHRYAKTSRYDSDGTLIWTATHDGGGSIIPRAVASDDSGSVYVAGQYYNAGDYRFAVKQYGANGNSGWSMNYCGEELEGAEDIAVSGSNLLLVGTSRNYSGLNIQVIRLNLSGGLSYSQAKNFQNTDIGKGVASGGYFVGGASDGNTSTFVLAQYDEEYGDIIWSVTNAGTGIGDNLGDIGCAVAEGAQGALYVVGYNNDPSGKKQLHIVKYE